MQLSISQLVKEKIDLSEQSLLEKILTMLEVPSVM